MGDKFAGDTINTAQNQALLGIREGLLSEKWKFYGVSIHKTLSEGKQTLYRGYRDLPEKNQRPPNFFNNHHILLGNCEINRFQGIKINNQIKTQAEEKLSRLRNTPINALRI